MAVEIIGTSGNIADVDASNNVKVNVEVFGATVTVAQPSGANLHVDVDNFPAIQPVSAAALPLPANAAQETGGNLATIATNTSTIATNTANETNGAQKTQVSDPTSLVAANVSAKGVQPANALGVQQMKDAGRSKVVLTLTKVASITTEALVTLTQKKGDATTTTGTSYTVTAGKTLRIQSMFVSILVTTALTTIQNVAVRLREGAASGGAVVVTSDIIAELEASASAVTAGAGGQAWQSWPDGIEIASGQNIGVSELAVGTAGDATITIVVHGFEY